MSNIPDLAQWVRYGPVDRSINRGDFFVFTGDAAKVFPDQYRCIGVMYVEQYGRETVAFQEGKKHYWAQPDIIKRWSLMSSRRLPINLPAEWHPAQHHYQGIWRAWAGFILNRVEAGWAVDRIVKTIGPVKMRWGMSESISRQRVRYIARQCLGIEPGPVLQGRDLKKRNAEMYMLRVCRGQTYREIGRAFRITGGRVSQIIQCEQRVRDRIMREHARQFIHTRPIDSDPPELRGVTFSFTPEQTHWETEHNRGIMNA